MSVNIVVCPNDYLNLHLFSICMQCQSSVGSHNHDYLFLALNLAFSALLSNVVLKLDAFQLPVTSAEHKYVKKIKERERK